MKYYKVIKFSLKIFRSIAIGTKITKIFTYENLELYGKVVTKRFSSLLSSYWIVVWVTQALTLTYWLVAKDNIL